MERGQLAGGLKTGIGQGGHQPVVFAFAGGPSIQRLSELSGLRHFEGPSFRGWHHHVTLVSAAHAYGLLGRASGTDGWQPPSGREAAD